MDKQKVGAIAGLGLVAAIGYYLYASTQTEETTIGGSGSFTGLGGSEGLLTGDNAALAGTSDSGINYNISLPPVDTSGIANLLSEPISGASSNVVSSPKETEVVSKKSVSSGTPSGRTAGSSKTLDSLAGSLGQVFGTPAQRTNERGDFYTTAAGGGAGAITGKSLGEQVFNLLTGKTAEGKSVNGALPTGASTQSSGINLPSSSQLKEIASKKQAMEASISQTKIAAPKPNTASYSGAVSALQGFADSKKSVSPSVSSSKKGNTISLAEAKKGSRRLSTPSTGKVIKVKR